MPLKPDDFTRLHDDYHQALFAYLFQHTGDFETAADLLQETFRRAIKAANSYRGKSETDLRGWLRTIAHNVLANYERDQERDRRIWRRLGRQRLALTDAELERLEEDDARHTLIQALNRYMADLPADQAEALKLRVLESLPYDKIASRTNTSEEAVRARVSRGLRTLRALLSSAHDAWLHGDNR